MALTDQRRPARTGDRFVLATVVGLAVCGLFGAPALARQRSRPAALAIGTSDLTLGAPGRRPAGWRLEGRRLTVRLPQPLVPTHPPAASGRLTTVRLTVRCGENTVPLNMFEGAPYPWAAVTGASATAAPSARLVRVVFPDDLAGRTNLCSIVITGPVSAAPPFVPRFVQEIRAAMRVRRGRIRGCQPGPLERLVLESPRVRVTVAHSSDGGSTVDGFRACLRPHGIPRPIDRAGDEGGAGGVGTSAEQFAAAGNWLAWVDGYLPHSDLRGERSWTIRLVDMTDGRPQSIDTGPGTVTAVAVGATGTVTWVEQPNPTTTATTPYASATVTYPAAELLAQRPGGSAVVLDRTEPVTCPIGCHLDTGAALTNLVVSGDGRTVTWTHAGAARTATLPRAPGWPSRARSLELPK
jgi:hypothetical protein